MDITGKLILIGLLLLATLGTGFRVTSAGKPLNAFFSTGHKLLALAWVIFSMILVYRSARQIESRTIFFTAIAVLVVSMAGLVWSGSMLTLSNLVGTAWLIVHRVVAATAVIAAIITARLLISMKPPQT